MNKILVVDDEQHIRRLVNLILGEEYHILEASDGEEAIDIARREGPVLILMDIMMPNLDGIGACHILKSDDRTKEIPVVMLTAIGDKLDQDYARGMGADGYMTKPFGAQELRDVIKERLAHIEKDE
ncbi:MAG TPA: response regulator [Dehalococcoidia bacterium]|nr:response regulator [Dehalococcoidia bacterium]